MKGKRMSFLNSKNGAFAPNNRFVSAVIRVYNYNLKNGGGDNLMRIATNAKINIGIIQTDKDNRYSSVNGGLIRFNPVAGLRLDDGNVLSPATGLEHEAAHAVNAYVGNNDNTLDNKYKTVEERKVIKGAELKTAKANGELPMTHQGRSRHSEGQWVVTKSEISNQEKDEYESTKLRERINNFKNNWTSE